MHTPLTTQQFVWTAVALLALVLLGFAFFVPPRVVPMPVDPVDRQAVLTPPGDTPNAQQEYSAMIDSVAKESSTLTLGTSCVMDPLVLKFHAGATLTIVNNDTVEHTVAFEDQNFFNVSPSGSRTLNISQTFTKGPGIYRYRCNDLSLSENVGVLSIVQ